MGAVQEVRRIGLVALVVLLAIQLTRVFLPIVFDLGERSGTAIGALGAGALAVAMSLTPLLAPFFPRVFSGRRALTVVLVALVALRVTVQLVHPVSLWLASLGMAVSLIALLLLLVAVKSAAAGAAGRTFVTGMLVGLGLDTAVRAAYWTWDVAWHPGAVPLLFTVLPCVGIVFLLLTTASRELSVGAGYGGNGSSGVVLIGPFLFLQTLFLQNPAFLTSSGHVSLPLAAALVLGGDAVALAATTGAGDGGSQPRVRLVLAVCLIALAFLLRQVHGAPVLAVALAVQGLAAPFLSMGLSRERRVRNPLWRNTLAFALGSLGLMLFLVLYQIAYRVKLPMPNSVLAPIAAVVLALGGRGLNRSRIPAPTARLSLLACVPLVLLLVPLSMAIGRPAGGSEEGNGRSLVLMSYNVHLGIDGNGQLNPEAIARVIESETPDVVALQEVARGWPGAGAIDLAEWLSRRLRMPYAYAPAADDQFGNLVLSKFAVRGSAGVFLPQTNSAMRRSYLRTVIDIGQGRSVTILDAHLEGGQPDHRQQVERLVRAWGMAPDTVIAGDMNMQPADPDRAGFEAAGLVSAQDQAGFGSLPTTTRPKFAGDRPDWIFGGPDVSFSGFRIGANSSADHRPLAVTVTIT